MRIDNYDIEYNEELHCDTYDHKRYVEARRAREHRTNAINSAIAKAKSSLTGVLGSGGVTTMVCHCGVLYNARNADLLRGWALACDKSCAATRRARNLPSAVVSTYNVII